MKVEIYADIVCPWCYIGSVRLLRSIHSFSGGEAVELSYLPYQLDPNASSEPERLDSNLRRKYGRHAPAMMAEAERAAHDEGLIFRLNRAQVVNTFDAHRLMAYVLEQHGSSLQVALMDRLYRAYFTDGENVADRETLTRLAVEVGVESAEIVEFLESESGADDLKSMIAGARDRGVTAVPTFVFDGRYALQGAQPPAVFLQALNRVGAEALVPR